MIPSVRCMHAATAASSGVELPCEPGAEHRAGSRQAKRAREDAWAQVMAGEQACDRVDPVDHGRRFEPAAAGGGVAVQGDVEPESDAEVAGADHAHEEARPTLGLVTAEHGVCQEARRKEGHDAEGDPSARQGDRQVPFLHCADPMRSTAGARDAAILPGMVDPDRRRRNRSGRLRDAVVWGTALGAASGAVLGEAIDGVGAVVGAVVGAAVYAPAEVITTMSRAGAEIKPLW